MDIKDFKHITDVRVRTYDVDSQGIVHNMNYLKYYETGRVEYRRNFGHNINREGIFDDGLKVVVVRNEIDYLSFAFLDDLLKVYTAVSWIKKSSFCFEQIITKENSTEIISKAKGILVNLDENNLPSPISKKFIEEITTFEIKLKILSNE
ncbi:MAG: acyl-CoA thioesterase [Bacteroidetes bacterium]|nr:acyl-CoA thioesterase [Bacteroidota bacterium]